MLQDNHKNIAIGWDEVGYSLPTSLFALLNLTFPFCSCTLTRGLCSFESLLLVEASSRQRFTLNFYPTVLAFPTVFRRPFFLTVTSTAQDPGGGGGVSPSPSSPKGGAESTVTPQTPPLFPPLFSNDDGDLITYPPFQLSVASRRYTTSEKGKQFYTQPKDGERKRIRAPEIDTSALIEENTLTLIGRVTNAKEQPVEALISTLPRT